MIDSIQQLRKECEEEFSPMYEGADPLHGMEHINQVVDSAMEIHEALRDSHIDINDSTAEMLMIACYVHDIFTNTNRKKHHINASDYVMSNIGNDSKVIGRLSMYKRRIIAKAVEQHRASSMPSEFHSVVGEILASADRGAPSLRAILERATMGGSAIDEKFINHMKDKYGTGGYVRYPSIYVDYYGHMTIHQMHKDVDADVTKYYRDDTDYLNLWEPSGVN